MSDVKDYDLVDLYVLSPRLWRDLFAREVDPNDPPSLGRFVDMLRKMFGCLDDRLPVLGLTLARLVELRDDAWRAEEEASGERWRVDPLRAFDVPLAPAMARAITNLLVRGAQPKEVACLLGVPLRWVTDTLPGVDASYYAVAAAHLAGKTVPVIEAETGVSDDTVRGVIRGVLGEEPHRSKRGRPAAGAAAEVARRRERVAELTAQGWTEKQIAAELGVTTYTVKNDRSPARRGPAEPFTGKKRRRGYRAAQ